MQDRVGKTVNASQKPDVIVEDIASMDQSKGFTRNKNQKVSKPYSCGQKALSYGVLTTEKMPFWSSIDCAEKYVPSCTVTESEVQASLNNGKVSSRSCQEYIDLDCNFEKDSR